MHGFFEDHINRRGTHMKRKLITVTMICSAVLLLCSGCGKSDSERVVSYLSDKYGEEFVVIDSISSGDGRTPFSYSYTAYCAPTAHPECMFETTIDGLGSEQPNKIRDFYGTGILEVRIAEEMKQKLEPHFGTIFVIADLNRTGNQVLPDMQEIEYFSFLGISPDSEPDPRSNIDYFIAVNDSVYQSTDYAEEYDVLLNALTEISQEYKINGEMDVYFMPDVTYQAYTEWKSKTLAPFSYSEYTYEYERIAYSAVTEQVVTGFNQDEAMTKEKYQRERKEKQN